MAMNYSFLEVIYTVACPLSLPYKRYLFLTKVDINSDEFIFRPMLREEDKIR